MDSNKFNERILNVQYALTAVCKCFQPKVTWQQVNEDI